MKMIPFYLILSLFSGCAFLQKKAAPIYPNQNSMIESWEKSFCQSLEGKARLAASDKKISFEFSQRFDQDQILFGIQTPKGEKILILTADRWMGDFSNDLIHFLMEQKLKYQEIRQLMLLSYSTFDKLTLAFLKPDQQCSQSFNQLRYEKKCRDYQLVLSHEKMQLKQGENVVTVERDEDGWNLIQSEWSLKNAVPNKILMTQNVSKCHKI
jgi:hypothetical protein